MPEAIIASSGALFGRWPYQQNCNARNLRVFDLKGRYSMEKNKIITNRSHISEENRDY